MTSCGQSKKIIYFQDNKNQKIKEEEVLKFKKDDLLQIVIASADKATMEPFNLPNVSATTNTGYIVGSQPGAGYLIDKNGNINMPIIGEVHAEGLTRDELIKILENKLKSFISDPIISIRVLNFKVTVLGEVSRPGTYTIPNEKISLLEALGLSGDLTILAKRKNIKILREENGNINQYTVDITKSDFINSPYYYLKQNDVVYISPNRVRVNSSTINTSNVGVVISAISLIITTSVLITK
jgi:polysaccharide export outer membrane protein